MLFLQKLYINFNNYYMILIGELMKKYILGLLLIIIVTVIIILSKYYLFKNNTDSPNNNLKFYNPSYKQRYNWTWL